MKTTTQRERGTVIHVGSGPAATFGFVRSDDDPQASIFVHVAQTDSGHLEVRQRVEFTRTETPRGLRAVDVIALSN